MLFCAIISLILLGNSFYISGDKFSGSEPFILNTMWPDILSLFLSAVLQFVRMLGHILHWDIAFSHISYLEHKKAKPLASL